MNNKLLFSIGFFLMCNFFAASKVDAKVFLVNDSGDAPICDAICTLRGAIVAANANKEVDTITIHSDIKKIYLSSELLIQNNDSNDGEVDVTINGNAVIDAQKKSRVFAIGKDTHVVMEGLVITGGLLNSTSSLHGAGIHNEGKLKLTTVKVYNNAIIYDSGEKKAIAKGAGIYNTSKASLALYKTEVGPRNIIELNGRNVDAQGAGIHSHGAFFMADSTVIGNVASAKSATKEKLGLGKAHGGGIYNKAGPIGMYITNSTIAANRAEATIAEFTTHGEAEGGGIYVGASSKTYITNSTISGNEAIMYSYSIPQNFPFAYGGAMYTDPYSKTYLANVTVVNNHVAVPTANQAGFAGGHSFFVINIPGKTEFRIKNSIVKSNKPACVYSISSDGYNSMSDNTCFDVQVGDQVNTDPLVGPLAGNGGFTKTHSLMPGSPAIDAGDPNGCFDYENKQIYRDQRGYERPKNSCDSGAFEV